MTEKCPYPGCIADDFHDGDHDFGRRPNEPTGRLRIAQEFMSRAAPWCEFHLGRIAVALAVNNEGYGWLLCTDCKEKYGHLFIVAV